MKTTKNIKSDLKHLRNMSIICQGIQKSIYEWAKEILNTNDKEGWLFDYIYNNVNDKENILEDIISKVEPKSKVKNKR